MTRPVDDAHGADGFDPVTDGQFDPATDGQFDASTGDEFDTPAEVDAVFRTQRRIALGYALLFLGGVLVIPALTLATDWWATGRLAGWWNTGFAAAGVGLYVFFFMLGVSAASLSSGVEHRMLGSFGDTDRDDTE